MADEFGVSLVELYPHMEPSPQGPRDHIQAVREQHATAMRGRPRYPYDPALGAEICDRITNGETLVAICAEVGTPSSATIYEWTERYPDFGRAYALARRRQAATIADVVMETAMQAMGMEGVAQGRLVLDAGKWLAAKLDPQGFGERAVSDRASINIADMSESDLEGMMQTLEAEKAMRRTVKPALEAPKTPPGQEDPKA
jgi:hypothetical protein